MATVKKATVLRMLFCDFCGSDQAHCDVLIRGRDEVHICPTCVETCVEIVNEHRAANKLQIEEPASVDAVDPSVADPGTLTTRDA